MSPVASLRSRSRNWRERRNLARHSVTTRRGVVRGRRGAQPGCEDAREALSCKIDGESLPMTAKELRLHVQSCASCAKFASQAPHLRLAEQVVLSKRPAPQLLDRLLTVAAEEARERHPQGYAPTGRLSRRSFGAALPRLPRPPWMPSRATVGAFAVAGGPAVAAVCVAALGPWSSHAAIAAHLTSNGCIAPLLARHLWPGY